MSLSTTLALIQQNLTISLGFLLVVGFFGNILNCMVFLRKRLRSNPCSVFFAAASIANVTVMTYFIIPTLHSIYNTPPENDNIVYCKIRLYIRNALLVTSRCYLSSACIACYAQSSRNVRIRDLFTQKVVVRVVIMIPIVWFIIPLHIPLTTTILNGKCAMWAGAAALYHSIYICFVAAILPTTCMGVFSFMAYRNLKKMTHNVHPTSTTGTSHDDRSNAHSEKARLQQRDRQLSKMLFLQVTVYMTFTIWYPINTLYNAAVLIIGGPKSADRVAIENFILFMTSYFSLNCYSAASFFVFLTSSAFRRELRCILATLMPCIPSLKH